MSRFIEKRVVVTGGGSGLGRALALHYSGHGWRVLIGDIDPASAQETADAIVATGGTALACTCDVREESTLAAMARLAEDRWNGFDIWINNAGVANAGEVADLSIDQWRWITDVNLLGCVRGARVAIPVLRRQRAGHLINVASFAGLANPTGLAAYKASKAAVISLSETLRLELAGDGIGVSVACPSFFATRLLETSDSLAPPQSSEPRPPHMRELAHRRTSQSPISASDVAAHLYEGLLRERFMLIAHPRAHFLWRLKRWFPELCFRLARRAAARPRAS